MISKNIEYVSSARVPVYDSDVVLNHLEHRIDIYSGVAITFSDFNLLMDPSKLSLLVNFKINLNQF